LEIKAGGTHRLEVALIDGDRDDASLESLILTRVP
jgi:hypothetical protein